MKIRWNNIIISGSPEQIVETLRKNICFTNPGSNEKYMKEVQVRVRRLYGVIIPTETVETFLWGLRNLSEIKIKGGDK